MKKQIMAAGLVLFVLVGHSQQPPKPPSVEDRLRHTSEVMKKEVQPTPSQQTAIEQAFKSFFAAADQLRKDNPPPPPPPPDPKVKAAMDKLVTERDERIKQILSAEQFEKYKEAVKKLHPPKPEEGPGNPPPPEGKN